MGLLVRTVLLGNMWLTVIGIDNWILDGQPSVVGESISVDRIRSPGIEQFFGIRQSFVLFELVRMCNTTGSHFDGLLVTVLNDVTAECNVATPETERRLVGQRS